MCVVDKKIKECAQTILKDTSIEYIDMKVNLRTKTPRLTLFIDKIGGVNINECADISQQLSIALFAQDIVPDNTNIEVSSPGIDRLLKTKKDFMLKLGRMIHFQYQEQTGDLKKIKGKLKTINNDSLIVTTNNKERLLKFKNIINAKEHIEF